jgi:hypothetical protein
MTLTQSAPVTGVSKDPDARSTEFVAVTGGGETTSAAGLLIGAYLVMWALLLGFIFLSWRRQSRVDMRIVELEKALGAGGSKGGAGN